MVTDDYREMLRGKHLVFSSAESPVYVAFKRSSNGSITDYTGICFEIIDTLKALYNFTYSVHPPDDQLYGAEMPNGTWSGMIGQIMRQEVEMAIGQFSITLNRMRVVDFTAPFCEETKAILIPPPNQESRLFVCIKPFELQVWLGLMVAMLLMVSLGWLQFKLHSRLTNRQPVGLGMSSSPKVQQLSLFVLAVLVSQSGQRIPMYHFSGWIVVCLWCLCALVLLHSYIGTLVSLLSIPKLRPLLNSIEDLADARFSQLACTIPRGTSLQTLFMNTKDGAYGVIGERIRKRPEWIVNPNDGVQVVIDGGVFIDEKSHLEYSMEMDYRESGQCRVSIAKNDFYSVQKAFAVAKGTPYKPIFDRKINHMVQSGLVDYWNRRHRLPVEHCKDLNRKTMSSDGPRILKLSDMQSAFMVWAVGITLSVTLFLIEIVTNRMVWWKGFVRADAI